MAKGKETRAQIDADVVRGLVITNGGAAAGLLAFLPVLLQDKELHAFSGYVLCALITLQAGLVFALVHNHLRRRCSLAYDNRKPKSFCGEPAVCCASHGFMWFSVAAFVFAGVLVFIGGQVVRGQSAKTPSPPATSSVPVAPKLTSTLPANTSLKADGLDGLRPLLERWMLKQ